MTHTGPRHPSLPSAEAGGAAGAACKLGLPRHRGVRFNTFQPFLSVLNQLLVELACTGTLLPRARIQVASSEHVGAAQERCKTFVDLTRKGHRRRAGEGRAPSSHSSARFESQPVFGRAHPSWRQCTRPLAPRYPAALAIAMPCPTHAQRFAPGAAAHARWYGRSVERASNRA